MASMKHTELRIGNIVSHEDYTSEFFKVIEIITIDNSYVVNTSGGKNGTWINSIELVNPIPLTEEWLLKLGFEPKMSSVTHNHSLIKNGIIVTNLLRGGIYYKEIGLKSVHQLQNLYFALTGEELNTL